MLAAPAAASHAVGLGPHCSLALGAQEPASASQFLCHGRRHVCLGDSAPHHCLISRSPASSQARAGTRTPMCAGSPILPQAGLQDGKCSVCAPGSTAPQHLQILSGASHASGSPQHLVLIHLGCPIGKMKAALSSWWVWGAAGLGVLWRLDSGPRCSGSGSVLSFPMLLPWTLQLSCARNRPHGHRSQKLSPLR